MLAAHRARFDDETLSAFVVARDPATAATAHDMRGLRWFLDLDGAVSRLYGALSADGVEAPIWLLLDPALRVMGRVRLESAEMLFDHIARLKPPAEHAGVPLHAPVLIAPRIFEPELCERLVALHAADGGRFTGVMRDAGDRTVAVMDELKKRRDVLVEDPALQATLRDRLQRRLFPLIKRALGFTATHVERYVVSCYDAADGAVFHAHRDSTTFGTAHRKFACSINLSEGFVGGDLRFPEFGARTYRPPPGGAVVFSCALLHEATRVTAGRRYAFLPFFYDEAGAQVLAAYRAAGRRACGARRLMDARPPPAAWSPPFAPGDPVPWFVAADAHQSAFPFQHLGRSLRAVGLPALAGAGARRRARRLAGAPRPVRRSQALRLPGAARRRLHRRGARPAAGPALVPGRRRRGEPALWRASTDGRRRSIPTGSSSTPRTASWARFAIAEAGGPVRRARHAAARGRPRRRRALRAGADRAAGLRSRRLPAADRRLRGRGRRAVGSDARHRWPHRGRAGRFQEAPRCDRRRSGPAGRRSGPICTRGSSRKSPRSSSSR